LTRLYNFLSAQIKFINNNISLLQTLRNSIPGRLDKFVNSVVPHLRSIDNEIEAQKESLENRSTDEFFSHVREENKINGKIVSLCSSKFFV